MFSEILNYWYDSVLVT